MTTTAHPTGTPPLRNRTLGLHVLTMLAGVAVVHGYMVFAADSRVTLASGLLLAGVAVYYALFLILQAKALRQRRFGAYIVHVVSFLIVNGSYWLHAAALVVTDNAGVLDPGWYGALFGMGSFWGLGLLLHTMGVALSGGFEDADL